MTVRVFLEADVMLLSWGDTSARGRTVTFLLDAESPEHPFRGIRLKGSSKSKPTPGQCFKMVLVATDENGEPIELAGAQPQAVPAQRSQELPAQFPGNISPTDTPFQERAVKTARAFRDMPRSAQAGTRLSSADFQRWLGCENRDDAEYVLKQRLGISSKKELDVPTSIAAENFDRLMTDYDMRGIAR